MAVDFKSLLAIPLDNVERPKPLPGGTYFGLITRYELLESKEKKTPYVRFLVQIQSPGNDVDPEAVAGVDFSKKQLRKDFFITPDALFRLKDFLVSCSIPVEGRELSEVIPDTINAAVMAEVTQRMGREDGEVFNDIGKLVGQS